MIRVLPILAATVAALTSLTADAVAATPSLSFVPNHGQSDAQVRYQAQAGDAGFFFTDRGATIALPGERGPLAPPAIDAKGSSVFGATGYAVQLRLRGARAGTTVSAGQPSGGRVNYLGDGSDRRGLPTFGRLAYQGAWPGVDLSLSSGAGQLRYEFEVAPGSDPDAIGLSYAGAQSLAVTPDGSLSVNTPRGPLTDTSPVAWQTIGGRRVDVPVHYRLDGGTHYGFTLGDHDPAQPLTIDPGIVYSSFLGGAGTDAGWAVAEDAAGNAYYAGETKSSRFPTTAGAYDPTYNGKGDGYITKMAPDGASLVYSTFIDLNGGADRIKGITVDAAGAAYATGATGPTNPIDDAFALKLAPDGGSVAWTRTLAGKSLDGGEDIAVDGSGNVYVAGQTESSDFPTTLGAYDRTFAATGTKATTDAFVTKLAPDGSTVWSTFLGGTSFEVSYGGVGIDVDSTGAPWVGFASFSKDYPTTLGAPDTTGPGGVVTKLAPSGNALLFSTFLGAAGTDIGGLRIGPGESPYVAATTSDATYPTTAGAYDRTIGGLDAAVTKFTPLGTIAYSTFLGGSGAEVAGGIDVDGDGGAYVTGFTNGADLPTTANGFDRSFDTVPDSTGRVYGDSFVSALSPDGSALRYGTYLGGTTSDDNGQGLAVNASKAVVVTGTTALGPDFPTTAGAFDPTFNHAAPYNNQDAFASKFDLGTTPAPTCDGQPVTTPGTTGTAGNDVILGTPGNDTIQGSGGDDRICGGGGDDTINGGAGNDRLFGQNGNDAITGGAGTDYEMGGAGNDKMSGGTDADTCDGQTGTDTADTSCEGKTNVP